MPIYVGGHSSDVWANQSLFSLSEDGQPVLVSGVPPDAFSDTGQLWGSPLYDWEAHRAQGYAWWVQRLGRALKQCDEVRVDHFRGFAGYWAVEAWRENAMIGTWKAGPGEELFTALKEVCEWCSCACVCMVLYCCYYYYYAEHCVTPLLQLIHITLLVQALGGVPILAEDLGVITPDVDSLREAIGAPGMVVLQFAWGGDAKNLYLPHNHYENAFVYPGAF